MQDLRCPRKQSYAAVANLPVCVGRGGDGKVVGDDHGRGVPLGGGAAEEINDLSREPRVQGGGRLIAEHDGRIRHERTRDVDALTLAAGETLHAAMAQVSEADEEEELVRAVLAGGARRGDGRQ